MTNTNTNAEMMTVEEVAGVLRVCPMSIRRYCLNGSLPAVRVGRRWLIARASVDLVRAFAMPASPNTQHTEGNP